MYIDFANKELLKRLSIAALPATIPLLPITAPVLAVATAMYVRSDLKDGEGDLTEN